MPSEAQNDALEVKERENSLPGGSEGQSSVEDSREDVNDCLKETPIRLPLVKPTIPSIFIEGSPYDSLTKEDTGAFLSPPESSVYTLSERLNNNWQDPELGGTEDDHRGLRRALSVSFGDVTVCGLLGDQGVGRAKTPRPTLDDLPYIDELILSAATPVLGPDNGKGRPKSLSHVLGALPEWLANKSRLGSLSTISRSSSQDAGDTLSLPRSVGDRHMKTILRKLRSDRMAAGDYHPRVLKPSVSLGAFGDWKDVENPTLTVSFVFLMNVLCHRGELSRIWAEGSTMLGSLVCSRRRDNSSHLYLS